MPFVSWANLQRNPLLISYKQVTPRVFSFIILIGILPVILCSQESSEQHFTDRNAFIRVEAISDDVDSIIRQGILKKAFPGAQVLVAHKGDIIFHKAYGYHTYDSIQLVGLNDLYDLASITKIAGPLPALMKLYEEGKIDLDVPFSTYWKPWRKSKDKQEITLREILAHQAGLKPYIAFLNQVRKGDQLNRRFIRNELSSRFQKQAFDDLYVRNSFLKRIYRGINKSEVSSDKKYRYSGLAFLIFPELISQISGNSYEYYLQKHFFLPLNSTGFVFNPKTKGWKNPIVPTEIDTLYRKSLVQAWVHDENASLMGGVSGNAGLFGTARDLVMLMQCYQNYGAINGERILDEKTVLEFTSLQYPNNNNRRGLGFDKPLINNQELELADAYPAPEVSPQSFGHSGFTGTFVWADPVYQLVYIFLSNRVYPDRSYRNLYELNIRTSVQQLFYRALINP